MKILFPIFCMLLANCLGPRSSARETSPRGAFFAEIRLTAGAFSGVEKNRTGFAFYIEENDGIAGPRLTGYRYKHGECVQIFGGASDSAAIVAALRAVDLRPFDFAGEVKSCVASLELEANAQGESFMPPFVLDGAEYQIEIITASGRFKLKEWNPGFEINYYASRSANIAKLKKVLDILSQYYGHLELGI